MQYSEFLAEAVPKVKEIEILCSNMTPEEFEAYRAEALEEAGKLDRPIAERFMQAVLDMIQRHLFARAV